MRSWVWGPQDGISALIESKKPDLSVFVHYVSTQRKLWAHSGKAAIWQVRKQTLIRDQITWHLNLGLASLHNCEKKKFCCSDTSLQGFVIASWIDLGGSLYYWVGGHLHLSFIQPTKPFITFTKMLTFLTLCSSFCLQDHFTKILAP